MCCARHRCDTTCRTGNVVVAALREGGAAALQGIVKPSDTVRGPSRAQQSVPLTPLLFAQVVAVRHRSMRQGGGSWFAFDDDQPGPERLAQLEALLKRTGPVGLRLRR